MQDMTDIDSSESPPESPDDKENPTESEEGGTPELEEPTNEEGILKAALSKAYWWDLKHEPKVRKSTLNKKVLAARKKARKKASRARKRK